MKNKPEKLETPDILYQYRPPELWALENLSRQVIHFRSPVKFNDPYDCNIPLRLKRLTEAEFVDLQKEFSPMKDGMREIFSEMRTMIKGLPEEEAARVFNVLPEALTEGSRPLMRAACFSARRDNLLMWSHYARHGKGFCLAFDTQDKDVFADNDIMPVRYDNKIPVLNNIDAWKNLSLKSWWGLFAYKSRDWEYEKEWRLLQVAKKKHNEHEEMHYATKTLKAVYFGTETTDGTKELVDSIVKEKYPDAELWTGKPSETEFKVEFDRIR